MESIPLTRVRHARNFAIALENKGAPVDGLLNRSHLPPELLQGTGDDGVISALSMLDFAENAAHHTGILDLGYWAGSVPLESYGEFGKQVVSAPTLYSSIMTFCQKVRSECSEADYFLRHNSSTAWFCHGSVSNSPIQQSQHELYALMIIVQVIQLALGSAWHPAQIRLQSRDASGAKENRFLLKTDIEFGATITAVEFPVKSLAAPLKQPAKKTYTLKAEDSFPRTEGSIPRAEGSDSLTINLSGDPLIALKDLIALYIRQYKKPTIELAAELAGVGTRTLQRFLRSKATCYSDLIDEVRYNMALPLLNDNSYTITDISFDLGYADVAHFSRAFKRITGMSPKEYRNTLNK